MLEGFGTYPVALCIDPSSYPGPASYTARFRNRSGWLTLAELQIESEGLLHSYTVLAACDEYGQAIPAFQASNLLDCGCSYPSACDEIPPDELDFVLDEQVELAKRQWVRETNVELLALHENAAEELEILEALTRRHIDECDRQIADMRRRRRLEVLNSNESAYFSQFIEELEADQDRALSNLERRRAALRANVAGLEDKLLERLLYRSSVDVIYVVNWAAPVQVSDEVSDILHDLQQAVSLVRDQCLSVRAPDQLAVIGQGLLSTYREKIIPRKPSSPPVPRLAAPPQISAQVSSVWTPERLKVLEEMWLAGRTATEIAEALGRVSRNAVIGRAHRIGLHARQPVTNLLIGAPAQTDSATVSASAPPTVHSPSSSSDEDHKPANQTPGVPATDGQVAAIGPARKLPPPPEASSVTPPSQTEDFATQRVALVAMLEALEIEAQKFLPGSHKTRSNELARADIGRQINELDRRAGMERTELTAERSALVAMLEALKIEGRKFYNGSQKSLRNTLKQAEIREKISALDRRIASAADQQEALNLQSDDALNWTDARVANLKKMWSGGLTVGEIAKALGSVSRNAVLSKAKRLGLRLSSSHSAKNHDS